MAPEALAELLEAAKHYDEQRPGLGRAFVHKVDAAIEFASVHSRAGRRISSDERDIEIRRFLVDRFPYVIFVATEAQEQTVIAVSHNSRRPGYWKNRLRK